MNNGDTDIRLSSVITLTKSYTISSNTSIDLNGHRLYNEISLFAEPLFNVNNAMLTLTNSAFVYPQPGSPPTSIFGNSGPIATCSNGGTIGISNCICLNNDADYPAFIVMNGGHIIAAGNALISGMTNAIAISGYGSNSVTIEGGQLNSMYGPVISTANSEQDNSMNTISINSGELTVFADARSGDGREACCVYLSNRQDNLTVNGGSLQAFGGTPIVMIDGSVNINNGTIIGSDGSGTTFTSDPISEGTVEGITVDGIYGIYYYYDHTSANEYSPTLSITGGDIRGLDASIGTYESEAEYNSIYITGGTFTPPTSYYNDSGEDTP